MNSPIPSFLRITAIALIALLTATQTTYAADVSFAITGQDAASLAAQQAIAAQQNAMQQTLQMNEAAAQAAQIASQNNNGVSTSQSHPQTVPSALTGGPIPAKIASAHTVYLMNDGTDPTFPIDETIVIHDVFTALKQWGRFQFVDNPNQADLVFSLHSAAPISGVWTDDSGDTYTFHSPTFVLNIVDPATNSNLWTVTSPVPVEGSATKRARWFSIGVQNLVSRLKIVTGETLSTQEQASLTTYPEHHYGRTAAIITGSLLVAGVATGVIMHHEFENSVNNQKQEGLDWCQANHVPLAECPANY